MALLKRMVFPAVAILASSCSQVDSSAVLKADADDQSASVLLYDDNTNLSNGAAALRNLGYSVQAVKRAQFVPSLSAGQWDLVVMDFPGAAPDGDWPVSIKTYIAGGGKVVASHWDFTDNVVFSEALQIRSISDDSSKIPVYPWNSADAIWTSPNDLTRGFLGTEDYWGVKAEHLLVNDGAEALGGFKEQATENEAAIVVGNDGRTVAIGYLLDIVKADASGNGKADGVDMFENAIQRVVDGNSENDTCTIRKASAFCWGGNGFGQLGVGDITNRGGNASDMQGLKPVNLGTDFPVKRVATGWNRACAISQAGVLKCWGTNRRGELGLGDLAARGGKKGDMGDNLPAINLGRGVAAAAVTLGKEHTCVLTEKGAVKCFGTNKFGQLGLGDTLDRGAKADDMGDKLPYVDLGKGRIAKQLVSGRLHTCALLDDATVKCWGDGSLGQLGHEAKSSLGTKKDQMGDALLPLALGGGVVQAIAAGGDHSCALFSEGTIKCWGSNAFGQLGLGDTVARGNQPQQMGTYLRAVDLGVAQIAAELSCGGNNCCIKTIQNTLKCWGANNQGQLGLGDRQARGREISDMGDALPFVDLGPNAMPAHVHVGSSHVCAVDDQERWKCWGANSQGQLGLGDKVSRGDSPSSVPRLLPYIEFSI